MRHSSVGAGGSREVTEHGGSHTALEVCEIAFATFASSVNHAANHCADVGGCNVRMLLTRHIAPFHDLNQQGLKIAQACHLITGRRPTFLDIKQTSQCRPPLLLTHCRTDQIIESRFGGRFRKGGRSILIKLVFLAEH